MLLPVRFFSIYKAADLGCLLIIVDMYEKNRTAAMLFDFPEIINIFLFSFD